MDVERTKGCRRSRLVGVASMALAILPSGKALVAGFSAAPLAIRSLRHPSSKVRASMIGSDRYINLSARESSTVLFSTREGDDEVSSDGNRRKDEEENETQEVEVVEKSLNTSQTESIKGDSLLSTIRGAFTNKKKFNRESLGKMGMSALLSYGFVSNVSGVIAVSSAWFIFSKKTGLSPIAPGQKPAFAAVYAGFTVLLNVIRPARFAFAMAISPYFERIRQFVQRKFGVGPRGATALVVFFVNFVGTCSLMALGIGMASALSGVPVWAGV